MGSNLEACCATWRSLASLGVRIAPSLCTPRHSASSQQSLGCNPTQKGRNCLLPTYGMKKKHKTGKLESPLLCLAMSLNTSKSSARTCLCCKGRTSRMWIQGAALVALLLGGLGWVEMLGFIPDPLFPFSSRSPSTFGSQILPALHLE